MEKQALQNRSFLQIDESELAESPTVEVKTLTSDSTQSSPIKVYTSSNKYDFIITSQDSPEISTTLKSKLATPKVDKAMEKIRRLKSTPSQIKNTSPIEPKEIPHGTVNLTSTPVKNIQEPSISTSHNNRQEQIQADNEPEQERNKCRRKDRRTLCTHGITRKELNFRHKVSRLLRTRILRVKFFPSKGECGA